MRIFGDDEYTPVIVWNDLMTDFGSKESAISVQGNGTKYIPDGWIYSRYLDIFSIFGYILDVWIYSRCLDISILKNSDYIWRKERHYFEYKPRNFDTCPRGGPR